jgi:O-antigen/teichoic acid export membrane protein
VFVLLGWHWVSRHALREMFAFGIWAFIGTLGIRVVYYTSAILIGLLLGVEDIAFYAIGFMVIDFARGLVTQVAVVMSPDIDKTAGKGDLAELQWLMIRGIRMTMFLAVPLLVGLMVFGEEFIALWMGPGYTRSAEVLLLLTISQFAALATRPCTSVLSGLGHVKFIAALLIGEGALNLLASLFFVLVTHLGIHGVALGTVVSMLITNSLVQPAYVCRKIGMLLGRFTRETFLRWIAAGVVFAAVCVLARMVIPPAGWGRFALKVAALGLCYVPVGLLVALGAGERAAILALPFRSRRARAECGGG